MACFSADEGLRLRRVVDAAESVGLVVAYDEEPAQLISWARNRQVNDVAFALNRCSMSTVSFCQTCAVSAVEIRQRTQGPSSSVSATVPGTVQRFIVKRLA